MGMKDTIESVALVQFIFVTNYSDTSVNTIKCVSEFISINWDGFLISIKQYCHWNNFESIYPFTKMQTSFN